MKKRLLILIIMITTGVAAPLSAESEYTKVGKENDLRLSGGLAFSNFNEGHTSWRGVFDYYLTNHWSFSGTMQIALGQNGDYNYHFGGLGMNLHMFHWGDLDFFAGGSAGFDLIEYSDYPAKLSPTIAMGGGMTLFGDFFNLTLDFNYMLADYFMRSKSEEIHEFVWAVSIGFKM